MYKLESLNEHIETVDLLENRDACVNMIVEALDNQVSYEDIEAIMVSEWFGIKTMKSLFRGVFANPIIKKKIRKLADKLIEVRVEIAKHSLNMDLNDYEDAYDADDYGDDRKKKKSFTDADDKEDAALEAKKSALEDSASALEAKMDFLANGNEKLERYIELQKIEVRLKANEMIIKVADSSQKKILKKYNKTMGKEAKSIADDLVEHYNKYESETAHGNLNEKQFDATPDSVKSREKIQDLQNKSSELIDKAREYEEKGEETKADIARLSAVMAKKKAGLESINMRIKKLKKKL